MKKTLLFRGPVETLSGYGSRSRDLLQSLINMDMFDIKIDSCPWGMTPYIELENDNPLHVFIKKNKVTKIPKPDIYIQVTVPNEFNPLGHFNIGITAGIETTIAPREWIDGCNKMDLILTSSNFSKEVLLSTVYNETDKLTGKLITQHKIEKPVEVLFEGINTNVFNDIYEDYELNIENDFAFLFVGHWLDGNLGQDRKDVGMLIKTFIHTFRNVKNKPALILKTSRTNFSMIEREYFKNKIEHIVGDEKNPPNIYLLFGEMTDKEMNQLYNHPKIKTMISLTKGEGFGRPLLEFSMTGKPIICSNWSGPRDFLSLDESILIGGKLTDVDDSAVNSYIVNGSKWFTANYDEVSGVMLYLYENYDTFINKSQLLKEKNKINFSLDEMTKKFKEYLVLSSEKPKFVKLVLPEFKKID